MAVFIRYLQPYNIYMAEHLPALARCDQHPQPANCLPFQLWMIGGRRAAGVPRASQHTMPCITIAKQMRCCHTNAAWTVVEAGSMSSITSMSLGDTNIQQKDSFAIV